MNNFLRTLTFCVIALLSAVSVKAQGDVTAKWDFKNDLPAFVLDGCLYSEDEIPQMREHAGEYIDLPPGADAAFFRSQEFRDLVDMYNDSLDDDGNRIGFAVFRDC